jgi:hypothetical protein
MNLSLPSKVTESECDYRFSTYHRDLSRKPYPVKSPAYNVGQRYKSYPIPSRFTGPRSSYNLHLHHKYARDFQKVAQTTSGQLESIIRKTNSVGNLNNLVNPHLKNNNKLPLRLHSFHNLTQIPQTKIQQSGPSPTEQVSNMPTSASAPRPNLKRTPTATKTYVCITLNTYAINIYVLQIGL